MGQGRKDNSGLAWSRNTYWNWAQLHFFLIDTALLRAEMHDIVSTFGSVNCIWRQLCDYRNYPGIILAHMYNSISVPSFHSWLSLALLACWFLCGLVGLSGCSDPNHPEWGFFPCSILISLSRTGPSGNLQRGTAMKEPVAEHLVPLKCKTSE